MAGLTVEVWTGTERQIDWARRIRDEAQPVLDDWICGARRRLSNLEQHHSRFERGVTEERKAASRVVVSLIAGSRITDAAFWINLRDCPDYQVFVSAVERYQARVARR